MPTGHSDTDRFSLLVDALRPWLGRVVFIGGWAHRLYRERPEARAPSYDALRTEDADIALAPGGPRDRVVPHDDRHGPRRLPDGGIERTDAGIDSSTL